MKNFYLDNRDLIFNFEKLPLDEIIKYLENNFSECNKFEYAPKNLENAKNNYRRIMSLLGDISSNKIYQRSGYIDQNEPTFDQNKNIKYNQLMLENIDDLKKANLFGITISRNFNGLNFPNTVYMIMIEIISRADASLQNIFGLQGIAEIIETFCSEEQKKYYLPKLTSGEFSSTMCLTEPNHGSDLQSIKLQAKYDENKKQWTLNGVKHFITNGDAKIHIVLARSENNTTDARGLSMFICESCPELIVKRLEKKMGLKGVTTAELHFNNVKAELCGTRRRGLIKYVFELMNSARISISAQAIGIAESAFRLASDYAQKRIQFNKCIIQIPTIYEMLAKIKLEIISCRVLLYETSLITDYKKTYDRIINSSNFQNKEEHQKNEIFKNSKIYTKLTHILTPICKSFITEKANEIVYNALQIHGGIGYMKNCKIEQLYRDIRATNIYEGTTQIQNLSAMNEISKGTLNNIINDYLKINNQSMSKKNFKILNQLNKLYLKFNSLINNNNYKNEIHKEINIKNIVNLSAQLIIGYILLRDAIKFKSRELFISIYIENIINSFSNTFYKLNNIKYSKKIIKNYKKIIEF